MNKSGIEWTDITWNPVSGCSKVSQGCKNCYAERVFPRVYGRYRDFTNIIMHQARLSQPLRLRNPKRIFVNSMSDLFHESVSHAFLDQVFAVMALCPQHTFQILTKRPERMLAYLQMVDSERDMQRWINAANSLAEPRSSWQQRLESLLLPWPLPNVWLGVSVEDQATADERIPLLLQTPAAVRFISAEPLLGGIDLMGINAAGWDECFTAADARGRLNALTGWCYIEYPENGNWIDLAETVDTRGRSAARNHSSLDLVIAGGESGPNARPSNPDWFRSLRDQCAATGAAFFFKQWGEFRPYAGCPEPLHDERRRLGFKVIWPDGQTGGATLFDLRGYEAMGGDVMERVGKKAAGRTLDGIEHNDLPTSKKEI